MIIVKITREELVAKKACSEGMQLFEKLKSKKGDYVYVKWTIVHQLWASATFPSLYGWLRDNSLVPQLSMNGANLHGANLHGADLQGADLRGAYLHGADLQGADLRGAYLQGAYLYGAIMPDGTVKT